MTSRLSSTAANTSRGGADTQLALRPQTETVLELGLSQPFRYTTNMTDVIAPSPAPCLRTQEPIDCFNLEEMAGNLRLQGSNRLQDVQVKVYRTSGEHFAVLYPQKKVCRPLGVINLKNTQVERRADGFTVRQIGIDPCTLSFQTEPSDIDQWVRAFTSRVPSVCSPLTPPIMEEDEEA